MRAFTSKAVWIGFLAAISLGVQVATAETPEERRQRRKAEQAVDQKCSDYKRKYEEAEKAVGRAPRGAVADALKKRDAALKDYCECLRYWCADAGIPLPPKYEQVCNPKPVQDPGVPVPDEFAVGRQPDVQRPPGDPSPDTGVFPGGAPETGMDPCEKLAYDIKTLEDMEELYRKEKSKFPQPLKRKLRDLRRAYAECQKPGTGLAKPDPVSPETGKSPGTGSTGAAPDPPPPPPPPPPGGGAFNPAGPGAPGGAIDRFFGDRTRQQLRGGATFVVHSANHSTHCSVCSQVRDGVTVTFERSATPGAIRVTLVDPPLPEISCQEQPGGAFDCGTVTASFCQMAPTVSIAHLKLAQNAVEDLGVRLEYPGDTLQFCTHGPTAP